MRRVLLAVLVLAVACGSEAPRDDPTEATAAGTVIPSAASPPGTALGDGFVVADGTTLIGDPMPIGVGVIEDGVPLVDDGWVATSLVDGGRPRQIVDDYLVQAEELGLVRRPRAGCLLDRVLRCAGFARSADRAEPRSLSVEVVRGAVDDVVSDHVVVRFSTIDLFWEYGDVSPGEDPDASLAAPTFPPLAEVGEPLGTAGETWANVLVQEGSRLAAPPHLYLDDAGGGIDATFEVTGDPDEVLQRYLDHLASFDYETSEPEELDIGGGVLTTATGGESGGDGFVLDVIERPGRAAWLRLTGSHD